VCAVQKTYTSDIHKRLYHLQTFLTYTLHLSVSDHSMKTVKNGAPISSSTSRLGSRTLTEDTSKDKHHRRKKPHCVLCVLCVLCRHARFNISLPWRTLGPSTRTQSMYSIWRFETLLPFQRTKSVPSPDRGAAVEVEASSLEVPVGKVLHPSVGPFRTALFFALFS
jgi:hypothetical protein